MQLLNICYSISCCYSAIGNDDLNKNHTNDDEADDGTDDNADDGFHFSDVIFCLLKHVDPMII